jgi:hypothetical protein
MQVLIENLIYRNERAEDWRAAETVTETLSGIHTNPVATSITFCTRCGRGPGFRARARVRRRLGGVKDTPLAGASYCTRACGGRRDGFLARSFALGRSRCDPTCSGADRGALLSAHHRPLSRTRVRGDLPSTAIPATYSASGFPACLGFRRLPAEEGIPGINDSPHRSGRDRRPRGRFIDDPCFHFDSAEADAFEIASFLRGAASATGAVIRLGAHTIASAYVFSRDRGKIFSPVFLDYLCYMTYSIVVYAIS